MIKTGTPMFGKIQMRNDEIFKLYPDIKSKKVFKWQPRISICNGLNRTIKFYEKLIKKNFPLISIVMNCHNGEKYLKV